MTMIGIAAVGFMVGASACYLLGYLMLKPIYAVEARIHQTGGNPAETDIAWAILNTRAELVMIRAGLALLNGLASAIVAVQLM